MGGRFEAIGTFWVPGRETAPVAGHLTFSPKRHGTLALNGFLAGGSALDRAAFPLIHGECGGQSIALYDGFQAGGSMGGSRVRFSSMLSSDETLTGDDLFRWITCRLRGLTEFVGERGIASRLSNGVPAIEAEELPKLKIPVPGGRYEIFRGHTSRQMGFAGESIQLKSSLSYVPDSASPQAELLDRIGEFRQFLALAMHQDCRFKQPISLGLDADPHSEAKLRAVWSRGARGPFNLYNRVLSYDDIGRSDGIHKWLSLPESYKASADRLASMRFSRRMYVGDAMLRVYSAADSFHRALTGKQREPQPVVLTELAEYASTPFTSVVRRINDWSRAVIEIRDDTAHNKGWNAPLSGRPTNLMESVYWLTFICLMRQAGLPQASLDSISASQPFAWPMQEIHAEFG